MQKKELSDAEKNWEFYTGNTRQFWNGQMPKKGEEKHEEVKEEIDRLFHSYNIISECTHIYLNTLIGKDLNWYFTKNGDRQEETEAEKIFQRWWDWQKRVNNANSLGDTSSQGKTKPFSEALTQMLVRGTGYLRFYAPKKYQKLDYWKRYICHCPAPGMVETERDEDNILYKATYTHSKGKEVYTLLDNGLTRYEIEGEQTRDVDLGGNLPIFEFKDKPIITDAAKQGQVSINKNLTLKDKNIEYAGSRERIVTGAYPPGKWVEDLEAPGGSKYVRDKEDLRVGPGRITFLTGHPIGDPRNPAGFSNANVHYYDPVPMNSFREALQIDVECIYMEFLLGHMLAIAEGNISGRSRLSIKDSFKGRVEGIIEAIEPTFADMLNTAKLILSREDKKAEILDDYTIEAEILPNFGDLLPEESQQVRENFNSGLISRNRAMIQLNISNPDREIELIKRERREDLELLENPKSFVEQFGSQTQLP